VFYKDEGDFIVLKIKAQPNASKNEFCGLYGEDAIKVRIAAPAVEGAANKEIVKFLSKAFKVPKSSIEFASGESSKIKQIRVPKSEKLEEFIKGLESGR
jgi:uncharacterized protein (TIGR00251 family)